MCIKKAAERKRVPTSYKKGSSPSRKSKYNTAGGPHPRAGGRHLRREHNSSSLNVDRGKRGCPRSRAFRDLGFHGHVNLGVLFDGVLPNLRDFSSQPAADGNHVLPARPVRLAAPMLVPIQAQARVMSSASTNRT